LARRKNERLRAENRRIVEEAVQAGIRSYAKSRRRRIPRFIDKHFSFTGAWHLNKQAFGWDLVRAPANLLWTPIYFLVKGVGTVARKAGVGATEQLVEHLPAGVRTDVERELEWLVYTQFLELPYASDGRRSDKNELLAHILKQKPLIGMLEEALRPLGNLKDDPILARKLERKLGTYLDNRKDVAELTTTIIASSAGLAANKTLSMGAFGLGQATAAAISHSMAVSGFIFGPTLGGLFYSALPWLAAPSKVMVAGATISIAALLGVASAFAGLIADPAQKALGLHRRKLQSLVDALERQLLGEGSDAYELRDGIVARLLDLADILYSLAR
jgi:hypothetical protein